MTTALRKIIQNKAQETTVHIPIDHVTLEGELVTPLQARSIVLFAQGSGSSRFSSRNRFVAKHLQREGMATLLFDLLTPGEEKVVSDNMRLRSDIGLLAGRLSRATNWVKTQKETEKMAVGYFGASTGAAAALMAENMNQGTVQAIVSCGGRPDLAGRSLFLVEAPTLFIVGGEDHEVITLNEQAMEKVKATKKMIIIPGATHLLEEPGAPESIADLASYWFCQYLNHR
jgi:dienelactone hydrolase